MSSDLISIFDMLLCAHKSYSPIVLKEQIYIFSRLLIYYTFGKAKTSYKVHFH